MAKKTRSAVAEPKTKERRKYLSQSDVPAFSLEQSLRVCRALAEYSDGEPVSPLQLAQNLNMSPGSGPFRMLCGASIAYGLTSGGYNAEEICLDELGKRIVQPIEEGDDVSAMRDALMRPKVIREFLEKYNGKALPPDEIATNVLASMDVPRTKAADVGRLIVDGAKSLGFVREIKGKYYVDLGARIAANIQGDEVTDQVSSDQVSSDQVSSDQVSSELPIDFGTPPSNDPPEPEATVDMIVDRDTRDSGIARRVFITHGENRAFLEPIKRLLGFGEMIPVVSVERQSVSKPVPDKVMDDMRSCGSAIIHVDAEQKLLDTGANEHTFVNPNVLIEIGASLALYGQRFILLVKNGVELPSNLQGLFEVRYSGDTLDGDATIRLLEAINDLKDHPLPARGARASGN